jgi:hypothetical protein
MLTLVLALAATVAVVLCTFVAYQLHLDRPTATPARHRPEMLALPPAPEPKPAFDPLDERFSLEEVERFLADLEAERAATVVLISAPPAPAVDDTRELEPVR